MTVAIIALVIVAAIIIIPLLAILTDTSGSRCSHCGRPLGRDHIPPDIRAAADRAGLSTPLWYVGRTYCPNYVPKRTLSDLSDD